MSIKGTIIIGCDICGESMYIDGDQHNRVYEKILLNGWTFLLTNQGILGIICKRCIEERGEERNSGGMGGMGDESEVDQSETVLD